MANDFATKIALFFLLGGVAVSLFPGLALTVLFSSRFAGAASVLFLFVVWQCLHHLVNVYLQLLIGLDDVRFYALLNCVAYAGAALAFRPLIDAYGLGGAAIALSVASVINAIGAAFRLAARFHSRIGSAALVRGVASVAAIMGAGALFRGSPELSTSGIWLRVAYLIGGQSPAVDDHERGRARLAALVADRECAVTKPSPDTERWKELDAASYDGVAEAFDRHSRRLSGRAAERLAGLVQVGPRDRVLDVGTGTGLLPFSLARAKAPPASILGIDISTGMIETARRRLRDELRDDPRVRFERMDAEQLQLPDESFDVVLSGFALTHVPRPELAMREIFRVLAPGGRLGVALGSRPPAGSGAQLRHAVAEVGRRIEALRGRRLTADLLDRIVDRRIGRSVDVPEGVPLATRLDRVPLLRSPGAPAPDSPTSTSRGAIIRTRSRAPRSSGTSIARSAATRASGSSSLRPGSSRTCGASSWRNAARPWNVEA